MTKCLVILLTVLLFIVGCSNTENNAPVITSLFTDLNTIITNDTIFIACEAYDPDQEELSYSWYINDQYLDYSDPYFFYIFDLSPDFYTLEVVVTDIKGTYSSLQKTIQITNDYHFIYLDSVEDAETPETDDIIHTLAKITADNEALEWEGMPGNSRVLVTTNTRYGSSYIPNIGQDMNLIWGDTWVFLNYEAKRIISDRISSEKHLLTRLKQLLGLPPSSENNYIVEMWINPENLRRPARDNEINDDTCQLEFPANADTTWINWFNHLLDIQYSDNPYPWTQLGYTYDWGNLESKVGLSEYIILQNSEVRIENVYTVEDYFQQRIHNR
ncbi:MAG: hypothetical protein PHR06_07070 [Candidatus Cloacimonetes bacterium]|nr:hypothetical protein [Candidatus Cloacimonadota bacterium]